MTDKELCCGKTFKEVMKEVEFHISDKQRIAKFEKENAELKEQIEKMKCCCKCKYYQGALCECTNQVYVLKASGKCNEWELAE